MRRREFISLLGGTAVAWPLAAHAQQPGGMRRIGALISFAADDPEAQARLAAFVQGLQQLGWTDGRNVRIDTRWAAGNAEDIREYAAELVALAPEVILATGSSTLGPLLQATRTVPIVFTQTADPVGAGFVDSLARPGGNATGFIAFEYGMSAKWLELLKQIAPGVTRVGVIRDAAIAAGPAQFGVIQAVAPSLRVEVNPLNMRDAGEIDHAVTTFARSPNMLIGPPHSRWIVSIQHWYCSASCPQMIGRPGRTGIAAGHQSAPISAEREWVGLSTRIEKLDLERAVADRAVCRTSC
jgi:putative tryptophan/tyrosine transport system substrate-binding protein